ncbi:MAG: lysophospholipid acyltransferase family protein [Hyphomicrobiales bacterium]
MSANSHKDKGRGAIVSAYSPRVACYFLKYLKKRFFPGTFHAVRLMGRQHMPNPSTRPIIIFMYHGSWWDPITVLLLADELCPDVPLFGPMDADMLNKYSFMRKIGAFPVESESKRGAVSFLRAAREVLSAPGRILTVTPQGEFVDPRKRPVIFKPGVAHLARDVPGALLVPLAVEQVFWNERKPELLLSLAPAIDAGVYADNTIEDWNTQLQSALEDAMDALAKTSIARDPEQFETLLLAQTGTSPVYDFARWAKAKLTGKEFSSSHGGENK